VSHGNEMTNYNSISNQFLSYKFGVITIVCLWAVYSTYMYYNNQTLITCKLICNDDEKGVQTTALNNMYLDSD